MDAEQVRRRARELSTDLLEIEVFLEAEQYNAEALAIYREELASRIGDLDAYVAAERERSGEERLSIKVTGFDHTGSKAPTRANAIYVALSGVLWLTSAGIGFTPDGLKPAVAALPLSLLARLLRVTFFCARTDIGLFELRGRHLSMRARDGVGARARLAPDRVEELAAWASDAAIRVNRSEAPGMWETVKGFFRL